MKTYRNTSNYVITEEPHSLSLYEEEQSGYIGHYDYGEGYHAYDNDYNYLGSSFDLQIAVSVFAIAMIVCLCMVCCGFIIGFAAYKAKGYWWTRNQRKHEYASLRDQRVHQQI